MAWPRDLTARARESPASPSEGGTPGAAGVVRALTGTQHAEDVMPVTARHSSAERGGLGPRPGGSVLSICPVAGLALRCRATHPPTEPAQHPGCSHFTQPLPWQLGSVFLFLTPSWSSWFRAHAPPLSPWSLHSVHMCVRVHLCVSRNPWDIHGRSCEGSGSICSGAPPGAGVTLGCSALSTGVPTGSGATGHSKADLRLSAGSRSWGPRWTQSGMA